MNGTGNTLISGAIGGVSPGSTLTKDGSGTLTLTGNGVLHRWNNRERRDPSREQHMVPAPARDVTVSNAGTTLAEPAQLAGAVSVGAGTNIAPGNGGNNTGILTTGALTLASTSNFRVDINGTTAGSGYDQINSTWRQVELRLPIAILWSQSARHYRSGRHLPF